MSEKESGNSQPSFWKKDRDRFGVYKITPYGGASRQLLISLYNSGMLLRWSLNEDNFDIKFGLPGARFTIK